MSQKQKVMCKIYGHHWDAPEQSTSKAALFSSYVSKKCIRCGKKIIMVKDSHYYLFAV